MRVFSRPASRAQPSWRLARPARHAVFTSAHPPRRRLPRARHLGEREAAVARELTKLHEEIARGRLTELIARFTGEHAARGEMVLVIDRTVIADDTAAAGAGERPPPAVAALVAAFEGEGLDPRAALKRAARELGLNRDEAYRRLVAARAQAKQQ